MKLVGVVIVLLGAFGFFFWLGMAVASSGAPPAWPAPVASAHASTSAAAPAVSVVVVALPPVTDPVPTARPGELRAFPPPAGTLDPNMEVCRSINTTCGGSWPQERCRKNLNDKTWTELLSENQVNCIIAAQGLVERKTRAGWIRGCAPGIACF